MLNAKNNNISADKDKKDSNRQMAAKVYSGTVVAGNNFLQWE